AEPVTLDVVAKPNVYIAGAPSSATVTIAPNGFIVVSTLDSGEGSLRQAILNANAIAGTDTITFAGIYTDATPDTITLADELRILSDLTIQGPGTGLLRISGNHATRVLLVVGSVATISGLTIADG